MKTRATAFVVLIVLSLGGCGDELTVPDLNNPSIQDLVDNPNRETIAAATHGLMQTARDHSADIVQWLGALGREGYPMSQTGASLTGTVINPLNSANFPGNGLWATPYRNIRNANLIFQALEGANDLSEAEKQGVLGFAKTIQANDFLSLILTRDRFGVPIDVNRDPTGDPAPVASREEVYEHIVSLLEEAAQHLRNAGASFPFSVHSGLEDFGTPAEFLELNRALRARVAVYMDDWSTALTALEESFLDTSLPLDFGAYHVFTTNSGDATNPLNRPDFFYAHTRLRDEAQLRPDGEIDLRAETKLQQTSPLTVSGITSDLNFTLYNSPSAPIPWVKNEELILLRAEALIGLGRYDEAEEDINFIRVNSGGLDPVDITAANALDELLYNKRYSLVWEYGHVWIDMRHYGRLAEIPRTSADPRLFDAMPIPANECFARTPPPTGCGEFQGL